MKKLLLGLVLFLSACSVQVDEYDGFRGDVVLVQVTKNEFERLLETEGFVILADPQSAWSQEAVPVFNEAARNVGITAYYYNATEERDNQALLSLIQNATFQNELSKSLYDELYLPIVLYIEFGRIQQVHLGTVASHVMVNREIPPLSPAQSQELQTIYESLLRQTS
jgi:hypothetical protein